MNRNLSPRTPALEPPTLAHGVEKQVRYPGFFAHISYLQLAQFFQPRPGEQSEQGQPFRGLPRSTDGPETVREDRRGEDGDKVINGIPDARRLDDLGAGGFDPGSGVVVEVRVLDPVTEDGTDRPQSLVVDSSDGQPRHIAPTVQPLQQAGYGQPLHHLVHALGHLEHGVLVRSDMALGDLGDRQVPVDFDEAADVGAEIRHRLNRRSTLVLVLLPQQ